MIPIIGSAGKYVVSQPYAIVSDKAYICRGISYIQSLLDKGVSVYENYYQSVGLSESDFNSDLENDEAIITLKSSDGEIANVPSSYITNAPTVKEVKYHRFGFIVDVGLLPQEEDFDLLLADIEERTRITLGVTPNLSLAKLPHAGFVTQEEHASNLKDREINLSYERSPLLTIQSQAKEIERLKQNIKALEEVVISLQTP